MIRNAAKENSVLDVIEGNNTFCTFNKDSSQIVKTKKNYDVAMKNLHSRLHNG